MSSFDLAGFIPTSGQSIFFDKITIIFLILLAAFIVIGIVRGFLFSLLSLAGFLIAVVCAFLLSKPVGDALTNSSIGTSMQGSIYDWILTKSNYAAYPLSQELAKEMLPEMLNEIGIPNFLNSFIISLILPYIPEVATEPIGQYIAHGVANIALVVISFLVLLIVFSLALLFLKRFAKGVNKIPVVGLVNRLLGAVFGLAMGVVFLIVVSYGLNFVALIPGANEWLVSELRLTDSSSWSFAKMLYEQNVIGTLIQLYLVK